MTFIFISEMNELLKPTLSDLQATAPQIGLPLGETRFSLSDIGLAGSLH